MNQKTKCFCGIADVDEETALAFEGREGFTVLTSEEFDAIAIPAPFTVAPEQKPADAPVVTGDPLVDAGVKPSAEKQKGDYDRLVAEAKSLGLKPHGKKREKIVEEIAAAKAAANKPGEDEINPLLNAPPAPPTSGSGDVAQNANSDQGEPENAE